MSTTVYEADLGPRRTERPSSEGHLLEVEDLHVEFRTRRGVVRAVNGISYHLDSRDTLAILGESGSGKSVSAQAIMGIIDSPPGFVTQGSIRFKGTDLLTLRESERRKVRGQRISMIFQDALSALNPVMSVGWQLGEMARIHRGMSARDAKRLSIELMERVRIPNARQRIGSYPHEFSGGMRQRIMIAMALSLDPDIIIADEPTTALDVTVQAQIMQLLKELQADTGMGLILITHDLGVVADVADRIAVMYAGKIVEKAPVRDLYGRPAHPYTRGLLESIPRMDRPPGSLEPITGSPPNLMHIPPGCAFHPRCGFATERCKDEVPVLDEVAPGRASACHYWPEVIDGDR